MKFVKTFEQFLENQSQSLNEAINTTDLEKYVKSKYKDKRINSVTFEEVLEPLASHIDSYTGSSMGDLEYTATTITLFKRLVDAMAQAHIDGNGMDESKVNEGTTDTYKRLIKRAKALHIETVAELEDLIGDEFGDAEPHVSGADFETAKKQLRLS